MSNQYSEHFKKKVLAIYPNNPKIHEALGKNERYLGKIFNDTAHKTFGTYEILEAVSLEELQEKARFVKDNAALYGMWHEETRHWSH